MSCGMQGNANPLRMYSFTIGKGLQLNVFSQAESHNFFGLGMCQVMAHPSSCVVGMCMRDHCLGDRPPRIDKNIGRRAVQPKISEFKEVHRLRRFPNLGVSTYKLVGIFPGLA